MKIHDSNNNLLAMIIKHDDILEGKNFETDNEDSFQIASKKVPKLRDIIILNKKE